MKIHIREGDIHLHDTQTRLPFKYGIATMTSAPHLFLRLRVEVDGKLATGIASDGLAPKWFTKDPARPIDEETHEMVRVIENALRLAIGVNAKSAFDAWLHVLQEQSAWGRREGLPPLLTQFGTSLVERALIEATCKRAGRPFRQAVWDNVFGIRLGEIHPCLRDFHWSYFSSVMHHGAPRKLVRQTVGMADALTDADIADGERLDDGLPQSLEASIRAYGLRAFKIKLSGRAEPDVDRLRRVAEVITDNARSFYFSLDGNEQFYSLDEFRAWWAAILRARDLRPFLKEHEWTEQPLHRSIALNPERVTPSRWPHWPQIIIDESDAELDSFARALELGYFGTSHKNCKGVFKTIINHAFLAQWRGHSEGNYIISGEDLCSIGPVAMPQDLVVYFCHCIDSVERNGHHYFAGLSMWPTDVQEQVLHHHGDLYHRSRDGWPTLTIRNGCVEVGSLLRAPFGVGFEMPVDRFLTPDQWRRAHPLAERRPEGGR